MMHVGRSNHVATLVKAFNFFYFLSFPFPADSGKHFMNTVPKKSDSNTVTKMYLL